MYAELRDVIRTVHQRLSALEEHLEGAGDPYWAGQSRQAADALAPLLSAEIACCPLQMAAPRVAALLDAAKAVQLQVQADPFRQPARRTAPAPDADDHL